MKSQWLWLVWMSSVLACSSARMSDRESDFLFQQGKYEAAAQRLRQGFESHGVEGRDALLYVLDMGLAYHTAGLYLESNRAFSLADQIAEIKDYTQLSREAATLLTTDQIKHYRGEDFENVLISTYLAMNYALMMDFENALVEARRVNHKLYRMIHEGQRSYQQSAFARYLSAILYEADHQSNDAYIDYQKTWELKKDIPGLGRDLWRCAWKLKIPEDMKRWDREFGLNDQDHQEIQRLDSWSELIILYENGLSPIKKPHPMFDSLPKFYPRYNPVTHASVFIDSEFQGRTFILENIEQTAIKNLEEKFSGILARKTVGVVTKEMLSYQIGKTTKEPLLGWIAKLFFYVSDRADLRSWNLLPKDLQMFRVSLKPGVYTVQLFPVGSSRNLPEKVIQIFPQKKHFINFRYLPQ